MPPVAQLLVILLIFVLFWFVLMRPARNQQRRMQDLQRGLEVGDEVVLSSGIFGTIRSLDDGRVLLEVAPGTELTVARQAVVRHAEELAEPEPEADPETPDESDAAPEGPEQAEGQPRNQAGDQAGDQERD